MKRKVLITAGSTIVPIDQVRMITNIFSGRTGTVIAKYFAEKGDEVTLITSSPQFLDGYKEATIYVSAYKTFDQLKRAMECEMANTSFDIIIHSSAVSDYKVEGTYVMYEPFDNLGCGSDPTLRKISESKKISSKHNELYLRLVPTQKLVDLVRAEWGFKGKLVKFKLEVGKTNEELIEIAQKSRADSRADFIVANCLEWMGAKAFIIDKNNEVEKVVRRNLPAALFRRLS